MQEHQVRLACVIREMRLDAVIGRRLWHGVIQRRGKQLPHPLYRMLIARNGKAVIIGTGGQGFTGTVTVQPRARTTRKACHHGALDESLRIDDVLVLLDCANA